MKAFQTFGRAQVRSYLHRAQRSRRKESMAITRAFCLSYSMPLKRAFSTSRGQTTTSNNYLVVVHGRAADGTLHVGCGEGQPRKTLTGDAPRDSWRFLTETCDALVGQALDLDDPSKAVDSVRQVMKPIRAAAQRQVKEHRTRPFRGTLLGIEVALLDLAARGCGRTVAQLLGQQRDTVPVSASTIQTRYPIDRLGTKIAQQMERWPVTRLKGSGEVDLDLERLRVAHRVNSSQGRDKLAWLDANEGMTNEQAHDFIERLARGMKSEEMPARVVIEQPVPRRHHRFLCELQGLADTLLAGTSARDLRIMPDESLWDEKDLQTLSRYGGCRAINIKPPKCGGLLPALDLARAALADNPDTLVYLGGMLGTSDLTTWTLANLGCSLPRLDLMTTMPPGNVAKRIATPLSSYAEDLVHLQPQEEPGIGSRLVLQDVMPYVRQAHWAPAPTADQSRKGRTPNSYRVDHLSAFGKIGLDSHLLELEALVRGLHTTRFTDRDFVAYDDGGRVAPFQWTKTLLNGRPAAAITGDKQSTKYLLENSGVPIPSGHSFKSGQNQEALDYGRRLGFPLVVKPREGTAGIGVVTDIADEGQLNWAIGQIASSKYAGGEFIVEKHLDESAYRMFVLDDRVLSAVRYEHGSVIGDGISCVAELIIQRNQLRRRNPHLMGRLIRSGESTTEALRKQDLGYDSVPAEGVEVLLTLNPNFAQGGDSVELVEEFHPTLLDAAVAGVAAIPGLRFAGVDFLVADHTAPLEAQAAGICEINAHPAQTSGEFPLYGKRTGVSSALVDRCVEHHGLQVLSPGDRPQQLAVDVVVRGLVQDVGYRKWMARRCKATNVVGWVGNGPDNEVHAHLAGAAPSVAAVVSAAIAGSRQARPLSVSTHQATARTTQRFEIR